MSYYNTNEENGATTTGQTPFGNEIINLKQNNRQMKRYAVTIDLYIHADSDADAIKQAEKIAENLRGKEDNHASVLEIWENKFGSLEHRLITSK